MIYECKFCKTKIEKPKAVAIHTRWCKSNPNRVIPKEVRPGTGRIKKHSEETKKLLSEKRKKYLAENKDKHPWSRFSNKETEPEKKFRLFVERTNLPIKQWVVPANSDRAFELDFADEEKQIAFEINGNQHYEADTKTLSPYYQERHDHFVNLGWKVVEIHYSIAFNESLLGEILKSAYEDFNLCETKIQEIANHRLERKRLREEQKLAEKKAKTEEREKAKALGIKRPLSEKQKARKEETAKRRAEKKAAKKAAMAAVRVISTDWSDALFTPKELESHLKSRKTERPTKEELKKLLWEKPTTQIAEMYSVSDKAISKWAKAYGLDKPARGYWAQQGHYIIPKKV